MPVNPAVVVQVLSGTRFTEIDGHILITITIMVDEDDLMQQIDVDYPKELERKHGVNVEPYDYYNRHIDYLKTAVRTFVKQNGEANELITFTIHRNLKNSKMFIGYIKLRLI
jgi:hypothetical protein